MFISDPVPKCTLIFIGLNKCIELINKKTIGPMSDWLNFVRFLFIFTISYCQWQQVDFWLHWFFMYEYTDFFCFVRPLECFFINYLSKYQIMYNRTTFFLAVGLFRISVIKSAEWGKVSDLSDIGLKTQNCRISGYCKKATGLLRSGKLGLLLQGCSAGFLW
jgi:hypothetical protein